jgi:predicted kinase
MPPQRLIPGESRTQQIARHIHADIAAGNLRHGQALPSTRELAREWGVSTATISDAMKILIGEGHIVAQDRSRRVIHAPNQALNVEVRTARPHLVLIGGYAGCGKTELGRILARETGWSILDKDTLTRPVVELALELLGQPSSDRESEAYVSIVRPREYEALTEAARENIACGHSAIVTAPFLQEFQNRSWISNIRAMFSALAASTTLVWVYCDAETMHVYLRRRGAARDSAKLADWPDYLATINVDLCPPTHHLRVDNSAAADPLAAQAKELLNKILTASDPEPQQ